MVFALISDIHSNIEALDSVLADIDSSFQGAKLVCAGDVVGYGPDPLACIERLAERKAICVIGNHDEMVLGRRGFDRCVYAGITAVVWTRRNLLPDAISYLDSLPGHFRISPELVVCHGNMRSADTYIDNAKVAEETLGDLNEMEPGAKFLVCGHTHHAALYSSRSGFSLIPAPSEFRLDMDASYIINPGAVGQSRDGKPLARYAVLDTGKMRVSFREVEYEHSATIRKLRQAGLVSTVVLLPPRGIWRRVERYKTAWARFRAKRNA